MAVCSPSSILQSIALAAHCSIASAFRASHPLRPAAVGNCVSINAPDEARAYVPAQNRRMVANDRVRCRGNRRHCPRLRTNAARLTRTYSGREAAYAQKAARVSALVRDISEVIAREPPRSSASPSRVAHRVASLFIPHAPCSTGFASMVSSNVSWPRAASS